MKRAFIVFLLSLSVCVPVHAAAEETDIGTTDMDTVDMEGVDMSGTVIPDVDMDTLNENFIESSSVKSEYLNALMTTDNFEKMFQNIQSVMNDTKSNTLAEYYKENYEITIPSGDFFDMSDVNITTGYDDTITNAQYYALASNFTQSYSGMVDASGKSGNSMQLFQQEYGDIAKNLKLQTPSIPSNFSMSNLVSQAASSVSSTYKSALGNSGIAAVRDSIDTQWIFDKALKGPDSYSLESYEKLQSMNAAASDSNKSTQYEQYNSSVKANADAYKKLSADVLTKSQSDLMKVVDPDSSYLLTTDPRKKQDIADDKRNAATDVSGKLRRKTNWIKDFVTDSADEVSDCLKDAFEEGIDSAEEFSEQSPYGDVVTIPEPFTFMN